MATQIPADLAGPQPKPPVSNEVKDGTEETQRQSTKIFLPGERKPKDLRIDTQRAVTTRASTYFQEKMRMKPQREVPQQPPSGLHQLKKSPEAIFVRKEDGSVEVQIQEEWEH